MNSGYYAACAGLISQTEALDLAANNLANLNTTGYRTQREYFRSILAGAGSGSALNQAINSYGVVGGSGLDLRQGQLQQTGNDLDVGIEGAGFFAIQTKAGVRYTRDGGFRLSPNGDLTTSNGDPVLGTGGKIQIPSGGKISISSDGTISVRGTVAGRLRVAEFAPGTKLQLESSSTFSAPAGSEKPAKDSQVRQGFLEASNSNPITATVSLIQIQRHAEMLQRALSLFNNEFNRIAAEDLPKTT